MRIYTFEDYNLMSERCADIVVSEMLNDRRVNLSLTGGNTPQLMYEKLIKRLEHIDDISNTHFYLFDETPIRNKDSKVVGFDNYDKYFTQFLKPANIDPEKVVMMVDENYKDFPTILEEAGGLDLMLIGMGSDGHFCANMPECTQIDQEVYSVKLTNDFPWNKPYQDTLGENYSDYMYTLGLPALMKARRVVLIVNGKDKAEAVRKMLHDPLSDKFPVTYLRLLPNLTILMDKDAASKL